LLIEDGWTRATDGSDPAVWHRDGVALRLHHEAPGFARHYTNLADPGARFTSSRPAFSRDAGQPFHLMPATAFT
jgi:hypothetical protein